MADAAAPTLSWARQDIEQRMAFPGARHTRVNNVLSFLIACAVTVSFYALLVPWGDTYFAQVFTERGPTQYATCLLSAWALAILFLKWRKLSLQRRALQLQVVPSDVGFVLSAATVDDVTREIHRLVNDPKQFVLLDRILIALSNLRNIGQVSDVDGAFRGQADHDESAMETSYALVHGFVWAIPVLGFIGTVLGLSEAIGSFGSVLGSAKEVSELTTALRGVTAGLKTAFETTSVALIAALVIQLLLTLLKKHEEEFFDACSEYCTRHIVSRLRILPFEPQGT